MASTYEDANDRDNEDHKQCFSNTETNSSQQLMSIESDANGQRIGLIDSTINMNQLSIRRTIKSVPPYPARWQTNGMTVAGGNGPGDGSNQLCCPFGLCVDEDQTIYIADWKNHHIMAWKAGATIGEVRAGEIGEGDRLNQLNNPTDVIVDARIDSLLICDQRNRRVMRWPRRPSPLRQPEIVIKNVDCWALAMDNQGSLYVSDYKKDEVRRYEQNGDSNGIVVAGGHGRGDNLNQLGCPTYLFVDEQSTLYVSDSFNNRVVKWMKGAKEGIVVAGGNGDGRGLTQLYHPQGVWVDGYGHVYVADQYNDRVVRWEKGAKQGTVIIGGNGRGAKVNQLYHPEGLFFDYHGHLYVTEVQNHRVQRFTLC